MNIPASIPVETAVWLRLQMTNAAARAALPLHQELERSDEWANGLFAVLAQLLPPLLRSVPGLAQQLEPQWRRAAERYEALAAGAPTMEPEECMERLEAAKMLHGLLDVMGVWKPTQAHQSTQSPTKRRK